MKKTAMILTAAALAACSCRSPQGAAVAPLPQETVETAAGERIIVMLDDQAPGAADAVAKAAQDYGSKVVSRLEVVNSLVITVPQGKTAVEAIEHFRHVEGVRSVQPDRQLKLH